MIKCPSCGEEIDTSKNFCGNCGADLSQAKQQRSTTGTKKSTFTQIILSIILLIVVIGLCLSGLMIFGVAGFFKNTPSTNEIFGTPSLHIGDMSATYDIWTGQRTFNIQVYNSGNGDANNVYVTLVVYNANKSQTFATRNLFVGNVKAGETRTAISTMNIPENQLAYTASVSQQPSDFELSQEAPVPASQPSSIPTNPSDQNFPHVLTDGYWCRSEPTTVSYSFSTNNTVINSSTQSIKHCYKFFSNGSYLIGDSQANSLFGRGMSLAQRCTPDSCVIEKWTINSEGQYHIDWAVPQDFTLNGAKLETTDNPMYGSYLWNSVGL